MSRIKGGWSFGGARRYSSFYSVVPIFRSTMNPYSKEKIDTSQFVPPRPIKAYPRSSIRKIAVLFTDVVGSTQYFKEVGDVAGREMLQRHQDIASSPIVEHGGHVVKTLGDSIMAYFMDPKEAVKSAIKIQQHFLRHNRKQRGAHQILVRIGIHFGEGIVEDHDIFGNVVNMAAKIVPLAGRDQIFVSHEVYRQIGSLSLVRCEKIVPDRKNRDLEGLDIYQIIWDETIHFDPTASILLFIRPLWELAKSSFEKTWAQVINPLKNQWEDINIKLYQYDGNSVILVFSEISAAIETARDILKRFMEHHEKEPSAPFLPVQVHIDSGPYVRADKIVLDGAAIRWSEIKPGNVYLSSSALRMVKHRDSLHTDPPFDYDQPRPMYRLVLDQQVVDKPLFMYRSALVEGRHAVCFYCGSRKHATTYCPSKKLIDLTQCLGKLGYASINSINSTFLTYLINPPSISEPAPSVDSQMDDASSLAQLCFYELKSIVQLRFFRNIWDSLSASWEDAKKEIYSGEKGGQIWLALDLIRTSRLIKAENLLNSLMLERSQDYKVFCTAGYLYIEQNQYGKAEYSFERALLYAKTNTQRIFILFLLSRLFEIKGNLVRAEEKIREILHIHPSCPDARYQRILYRFHNGQHKRALAELTKLIFEQKEFYLRAMIDPELAPFSNIVDKRLQKLFDETQERADHLFPIADSEKKRLEALLGHEALADKQMQLLWKKTQAVLNSESYFGYLDAIKTFSMVINRCLMAITNWKKMIGKRLSRLRDQLQILMTFVGNYPYRSLTLGIRRQLQMVQKELESIEEIVIVEAVEKFKEAYSQAAELSSQLEGILPWLKWLYIIRKSAYFLDSFLKVSVTLQTINLLVGIILLPVVSHYVVVVFPELQALNQDLWLYQKGYLIMGGIFALLMSIIKPLRNLSPKSRSDGGSLLG